MDPEAPLGHFMLKTVEEDLPNVEDTELYQMRKVQGELIQGKDETLDRRCFPHRALLYQTECSAVHYLGYKLNFQCIRAVASVLVTCGRCR